MNFEEHEPQTAATGPETREAFAGDHWELESSLRLPQETAEHVAEYLASRGWSEDEIGHFPLVVNETVANAVIHGNWELNKKDFPDEESYKKAIDLRSAEEGPHKKVTVDLHMSDDGNSLELIIEDQGKGFNEEDIPNPTSTTGLHATSGRGVYLMRALDAKPEFFPGEPKIALHWDRRKAAPAAEDDGWVNIKNAPIEIDGELTGE